jgi:hypothetical protein
MRMLAQLFMGGICLLIGSGAIACSCMSPSLNHYDAVRSAYESADSVVIATAENIVQTDIPYSDRDGSTAVGEVTEFVSVSSFKGSHGKRFYTRIITACCMCGFVFEIGRTYLLYLVESREPGYYTTSICSRTEVVEMAADDIAVLESLAPNQSNKSQPPAAGTH